MNFPIQPHDILSLMEDSAAALALSPSSARRAYVCVIMAAHLAEHVAAAKGLDALKYRDQIEAEEPTLKLMRDIGNYAKHVHITRYSPVAVSGAIPRFRSLADIADDNDQPGHVMTDGFYVRDSSSRDHSLLTIVRATIFFWREELLRLDLQP